MSQDPHRAYQKYLLDRMADVLGLNLELELDLARITRAQYTRALERCAECPDPEGCELWLGEHAAGTHKAPEMCRNKALLEHLRESY